MATPQEVSDSFASIIQPYTDVLVELGNDEPYVTQRMLSLFGVPDASGLPEGWSDVQEWVALRRALTYAATLYDFTADGGTYRRSKFYDNLSDLLEDAAERADKILKKQGINIVSDGGTITLMQMVDRQDPYSRETYA